VGDEDDGDNLEKMLRAIELEILLKSKKGLDNLDMCKKHRRLSMLLKRVV
jgi:hypothetical protein